MRLQDTLTDVHCPNVASTVDHIPPHLKAQKRWLPRCGKAPERYRSFEKARQLAADENRDGVGYNVVDGDRIVVIDIDHCLRADGTVAPIVQHWLRRGLRTYAERSMNDGVHLVLKAEKRVEGSVFWLKDPTGGERFKVEIWDKGHFVVLTGNHIEGCPSDIVENQQGLDEFIAALDGNKSPPGARANGQRPERPQASPTLSDDVVLHRARNLPYPDDR